MTSPATAACFSAARATSRSFRGSGDVCCGAVPLLPYFVMEPTPQAFWWSVATTFGALSALGLLRWNATGEPIARSVGETILVGAVCAVVAYGVGLVVAG